MTKTFLTLFSCFILWGNSLFGNEGNYKIESVFSGYDGDKKYYLLTLFLPYNPIIISNTNDPRVQNICNYWWPKGSIFFDQDASAQACDLLWIESSDNDLKILKHFTDKIREASAIFTTTHFSAQSNYPEIKSFLESCGFTFLGHWYWENQEGEAMFIRNDLFAAAMRTLNYSPTNFSVPSIPSQNKLEQYFQKAHHKSHHHKMDEIDFIYMINLDERPEKFALASHELALFGIFPYRFSAVNGWNLSTEVLNQVGVKFSSDFGQEKFLGTIYREIDGREYLGHEILRPNGETFFTLGMSHGAIGIVLSHLSVLQDAYDSGYQTIWVMEDDVEAVHNPRLLSDLIPKLDSLVDDWDILFTDIDTKDRIGNHVPCRAVAARPNVNMEPLSSFFQRFYPVSSDFSRIGMRYGAYSMIVRRSGMEKILKYFKNYGIFIPYDMDIWLNPDLKMYSVTQDIVSHRSGAPTDNSEPNYLKKKNP
jgi:GR25 family glycosyltransferase involved in LPS biosynthesis